MPASRHPKRQVLHACLAVRMQGLNVSTTLDEHRIKVSVNLAAATGLNRQQQ